MRLLVEFLTGLIWCWLERVLCCSWSLRLMAYEARRLKRCDGRLSNCTERRGVISRDWLWVWNSVRSGPRKREPRRMKPFIIGKPPLPIPVFKI